MLCLCNPVRVLRKGACSAIPRVDTRITVSYALYASKLDTVKYTRQVCDVIRMTPGAYEVFYTTYEHQVFTLYRVARSMCII